MFGIFNLFKRVDQPPHDTVSNEVWLTPTLHLSVSLYSTMRGRINVINHSTFISLSHHIICQAGLPVELIGDYIRILISSHQLLRFYLEVCQAGWQIKAIWKIYISSKMSHEECYQFHWNKNLLYSVINHKRKLALWYPLRDWLLEWLTSMHVILRQSLKPFIVSLLVVTPIFDPCIIFEWNMVIGYPPCNQSCIVHVLSKILWLEVQLHRWAWYLNIISSHQKHMLRVARCFFTLCYVVLLVHSTCALPQSITLYIFKLCSWLLKLKQNIVLPLFILNTCFYQ